MYDDRIPIARSVDVALDLLEREGGAGPKGLKPILGPQEGSPRWLAIAGGRPEFVISHGLVGFVRPEGRDGQRMFLNGERGRVRLKVANHPQKHPQGGRIWVAGPSAV